jgi:hypothetical protein
MSAPDKSGNKYKHTDQERDNNSHDDKYGVNAVELLAENEAGDALLRLKADTDGNLLTAGGGGGGNGAILDGADSAIKATVKDLTNSNPLTTALVDANGDQITSFGGGTQYTEGDTDATFTGTISLVEGSANAAVTLKQPTQPTDTQPISASALPLPTGAATAANQQTDALTDTELRATPVPVSGTVTATPTGTQNVDVTANTIGLATSAKQDTLLTELQLKADLTETQPVGGNVASGASDSGNPVKVGGRYNSTQPTLTNGQRGDAQTDTRGNLKTVLMVNDTATTISGEADNADGVAASATANNLSSMARNTVYNGTTWDRQLGNATDGTLVNLGANNDVTVTSGAITETNSAAIKTAVETIDNAISGNEMQVDVVGALPAGTNNIGDVDVLSLPALPAGTNAIGKLSANSGVDIGDVDVTSSVSATLDHGSNLDIDTTAEQITTTSFAAKFGVTVKSAADNTDTVYIGNSDVTAGTTAATDGFPLEPGESITLPVNNPNLLYAISASANQKVFWSAV